MRFVISSLHYNVCIQQRTQRKSECMIWEQLIPLIKFFLKSKSQIMKQSQSLAVWISLISLNALKFYLNSTTRKHPSLFNLDPVSNTLYDLRFSL